MNANRFTQKSIEAIQTAQQFADANRNTQVEQLHLLKALIDENDDLNAQLFSSMQEPARTDTRPLSAAPEGLPRFRFA